LDVVRLEEDPGHIPQEGRLPLALGRVSRTPARPRRELADHDRRDEVDAEREPVLRVAQASVWMGGRKKKLNASMLAIETATAKTSPNQTATASTTGR
jgi:hypothetical protein